MTGTNHLAADTRSLLNIRATLQAAEDAFARTVEVYDGMAVSMAHDAVEHLLWTIIRDANLAVPRRADFDELKAAVSKYFDESVRKRLPHDNRLKQLNSVRVAYKHQGLLPNRIEVERLLATSRSFVEESLVDVYGLALGELSEADLVVNAELKAEISAYFDALKADEMRAASEHLAWAKNIVEKLALARLPVRGVGQSRIDLRTNNRDIVQAANAILQHLNSVHSAMFQSLFLISAKASAAEVAKLSLFLPSVHKTGDGQRHAVYHRIKTPTKDDLEDCRRLICRMALSVESP